MGTVAAGAAISGVHVEAPEMGACVGASMESGVGVEMEVEVEVEVEVRVVVVEKAGEEPGWSGRHCVYLPLFGPRPHLGRFFITLTSSCGV